MVNCVSCVIMANPHEMKWHHIIGDDIDPQKINSTEYPYKIIPENLSCLAISALLYTDKINSCSVANSI